MPEVNVNYLGKREVAAMSLTDALEMAEPSAEKVRCAVSVPNGDFIALSWPIRKGKEKLSVKRLTVKTGQGGTELDTGKWIDHEAGEFVPLLWRPG